MTNTTIYQHYSEEDRRFIDQVTEMINRVEDSYSLEVTSFINPHQVTIVQSLANKHDLKCFSSSTYFSTEWSKVIVAPDYYELDLSDFQLSLLEIAYSSKFYDLTHSQIMGTLLHKLGIERKVFGDILVQLGQAQIFVDQRFSVLFINQIQQIAKVPVKLKEIPLDKRILAEETKKSHDILVSSMRLDKLIATSFHLSRKLASDLILGKQAKLNYSVVDNPSEMVAVNDLISLRRYGRVRIISENGFSKNGKHKLSIEILSSK